MDNCERMKVEGLTKKIMENLKEPTTIKELAKKLNIHPKNLDVKIRVLRDLGLVETKKGRNGWVRLSKEGLYLLEKGEIKLNSLKLQIVAKDRIGLLADITSKISKIGGNITSTILERDGEDVIIYLIVENVEKEEIENALKDIVKKFSIIWWNIMIEIEIKVKIDNKDEIIEKLKKLGFKFIKKKFQEDIYFNGSNRDFKKTDEALRIRDDNGTFFITYKGPKLDNISKTREEIEVKIEDKEKMRLILKKLGFKEVPPIRKIREIYKRGDIIASIDNVEGLGIFLELEKSISDSEITKKDEILNELLDLLKSLNISKDKIIRKSYLELRG